MTATTDFQWDDFAGGGDFPERVKFEQPGQSVVGTITNIRVTDFGGTGDRTPELWLAQDDGTEISFVASQTRLRSALAEQRPQVGDRLAVVFTGLGEAKPPKSAPKLFDVKLVRAGGGASSPAQPAPTPVEQPQSTPAQPTSPADGPSAADLI